MITGLWELKKTITSKHKSWSCFQVPNSSWHQHTNSYLLSKHLLSILGYQRTRYLSIKHVESFCDIYSADSWENTKARYISLWRPVSCLRHHIKVEGLQFMGSQRVGHDWSNWAREAISKIRKKANSFLKFIIFQRPHGVRNITTALNIEFFFLWPLITLFKFLAISKD